MSETAKCRDRLAKYCVGCGLDLGPGGDPIIPTAIRIDLPQPYSHAGPHAPQLTGTATNLYWFQNNILDYVYSSHLLEDFQDTETVLREWLRVLKPSGHLIIFCPDEQAFRTHCKTTGQAYNTAHIHANFSLNYVQQILDRIAKTTTIHAIALIDIYSWELVCKKV